MDVTREFERVLPSRASTWPLASQHHFGARKDLLEVLTFYDEICVDLN